MAQSGAALVASAMRAEAGERRRAARVARAARRDVPRERGSCALAPQPLHPAALPPRRRRRIAPAHHACPPPAPPPSPVGDWEAAGAQFFSREQLYDMQWQDVDLETKRWVVWGPGEACGRQCNSRGQARGLAHLWQQPSPSGAAHARRLTPRAPSPLPRRPTPQSIAAAPFGGPIAMVRDERVMVPVVGAGPTRPVVRIFSAAGAELGSFLWERGRLAGWGWSDAQELVLVEPTGKVGALGVGLPRWRAG
jgi:hypothetical protein